MLNNHHFLRRLVIEPTYACNLHCQHCYVRRSARAVGRTANLEENRPVSFWQEMLRNIPPGISLHFTGGELFVYPEIFALLECTRDRFSFTISTNATCLDPEACERLADLAPRHVTVSLLGPEPIHDAITGVPGSYRRTLRAVQTLRDWLPDEGLSVNFVLLPVNVTALEAVIHLVERLGIAKLVIQLFDPALNRCGIVAGVDVVPPPDDLDWSQIDLNTLRRTLTSIQSSPGCAPQVLLASSMTTDEIISYISGRIKLEQWTCAEVFDTLRCSPTGQAYTCTGLALGSLAQHSPLEIWESSKFVGFRQSHLQAGLRAGCVGCCKIRRIT
jgi:MoaA/NifB/PqqE/SkfB family radical SAM enzyme